MSRGSPTFTDNSRATFASLNHQSAHNVYSVFHNVYNADSLAGREHFADRQFAIGTVRGNALAWLEMELFAIEMNRDDVRLERHAAGDAVDLRVGIGIAPGRGSGLADVVVATDPFIRAEGLVLREREDGLVDVRARHVPARREAGLIEHERLRGIGDDVLP